MAHYRRGRQMPAKPGAPNVHHMNSGFHGAQSAARLVAVLKLLARHHVRGLSIRELSDLCGLDRSTARRHLMVLVATGFAARDAASGRYSLGVEAMLCGLETLARPPVFEVCRPVMANVARRTQDSVFLIIRNGDFAHCLHVQSGTCPLPAHSLMTGQIRLLGQGTASLALAATLHDRELDRIHQRRRLDYESAGISHERLRTIVAHTRRQGHAESLSLLTSGAAGIGLPIALQDGHVAALSVAGHHSHLDGPRKDAALCILRDEIGQAGLQVHRL